MSLTRRFFLGGLAALALVRPSVAATEPVITTPAVLSPVPSPTNMWQDMARQIPAVKPGDPVAYVTKFCVVNGEDVPMVQPDPDLRPTLGVHAERHYYIQFDRRDQHLCENGRTIPKRLYKAAPHAKVFKIKMSNSTSAQALATTEQDVMRKWIR